MAEHTCLTSLNVTLSAGVDLVTITKAPSSFFRISASEENTDPVYYQVGIGVAPVWGGSSVDGLSRLDPGTDHVYEDFTSFSRGTPREMSALSNEARDNVIVRIMGENTPDVFIEAR